MKASHCSARTAARANADAAKRDDAGASLGLTATGQLLGSPSYASPEQAAGRLDEIAAPTDVYGLGAILYHVITGRAPFVAATATQRPARSAPRRSARKAREDCGSRNPAAIPSMTSK